MGPVYEEEDARQCQWELASAYRECLRIANEEVCSSTFADSFPRNNPTACAGSACLEIWSSSKRKAFRAAEMRQQHFDNFIGHPLAPDG